MEIHCRPIINSDDIEGVVDLHGLIWFTDDRDAIPSHVLLALQHVGAVLLGAFDGTKPVGFSLAFPGDRHGRRLLWSHATGVLPEYQGRGIGKDLKYLQRKIAIENGYDCIGWTFDPLQAGNANFNISQLGCTCSTYHIDFYGKVQDGLNNGLPTDRFEALWSLTRQRSSAPVRLDPPEEAVSAVVQREDSTPSEELNISGEQRYVLVEIPGDINLLRATSPDLALAWRLATRNAFTKLFASGFAVVDFIRYKPSNHANTRFNYVLQRT